MAAGRTGPSIVALLVVALALLTVAGCGGGGGGSAPETGFPANLENYHSPQEWEGLIKSAGLSDYADLGEQLISEDKIKVVAPPALDPNFNAFSFIEQSEIWINSPMFSRYPSIVHQATIFLHEMVHIKSGEASHSGAWWTVVDQFASYWQTHSAAAYD